MRLFSRKDYTTSSKCWYLPFTLTHIENLWVVSPVRAKKHVLNTLNKWLFLQISALKNLAVSPLLCAGVAQFQNFLRASINVRFKTVYEGTLFWIWHWYLKYSKYHGTCTYLKSPCSWITFGYLWHLQIENFNYSWMSNLFCIGFLWVTVNPK